MKKNTTKQTVVLMLAALALWTGSSPAKAQSTNGNCELPTNAVCYVTSQRFEFTNSFLNITLSGVPAGFDVTNGTYTGWCIEAFNLDLTPGSNYCDAILRATDEPLPSYLQGYPWGIINYILNHKQGTNRDIQNAIWHFTDSYVPPLAEQTAAYLALIADATGQSSFVPGPGELVAIILDLGPNSSPQRQIIELVCPPENPGARTPGYWKNHPEAWPISTIVLGGVTYTEAEAIAIMQQSTSKDKTYNLAEQLIAAILNGLIGNDVSCISDTIANAQLFLATYPIGSGVKASSTQWQALGSSLLTTLDAYNNGLLCAPAGD